MNTIARALWRTGSVVCGLLAFGGVIALFDAFARHGEGAGIAAVLMVVFWLCAWWQWRRADGAGTGAARASMQPLVQEAAAFVARVNETRRFEPVSLTRIVVPARTPLLVACEARMLEIDTRSTRRHVGTRLKLGAVPLYLAQSTPT